MSEQTEEFEKGYLLYVGKSDNRCHIYLRVDIEKDTENWQRLTLMSNCEKIYSTAVFKRPKVGRVYSCAFTNNGKSIRYNTDAKPLNDFYYLKGEDKVYFDSLRAQCKAFETEKATNALAIQELASGNMTLEAYRIAYRAASRQKRNALLANLITFITR